MTSRSLLLLTMMIVLAAFYALLVLRRETPRPAFPSAPPSEGTSYEEVEGYLRGFKTRSLAKLQSVGKSALGKTIYAVFPRTGPTDEDSGRLLIVAGQHGVEPLPADAAMQMIDAGDFKRSRVVVAVIPVANPDGLPYWYRFNWNNVDLNRDWPNPTQPETIAISAFIEKFKPDVVIDLHEGQPYKIEEAQSSNPARDRLAKAGKARAKANGFDVPILHNSAGAHGGLLHRLMGMQGRVGLMLESPMDVDPAVREPLYTAFVSGVVDAMGKEQWRRARR